MAYRGKLRPSRALAFLLAPPHVESMAVRLRPAIPADIPALARWNEKPHVIAATTDDPDQALAFGDIDWAGEIAAASPHSRYYIAELDGLAIGALQIADPYREETHYWGDIEPNLRAIDIWIGEEDRLGRGHGEEMMRIALRMCFSDPDVSGIVIDPLASNVRAHKFYRRLGFEPVGLQRFGDGGEDLCLVHRLDRAAWRRRFPDDQPDLPFG